MRLPYPSSPPAITSRQPGPGAAGALEPARRARPAAPIWEAVLFRLLLAVVLLAPLPLGSNRPLPASTLAAAVGALLCLWAVGRLRAEPQASVPVRPLWPAAVLFGAAAAWAAVQAAPGTPAALHHPYWSAAREVLALPDGGAISVNPAASWSRLTGLLAYAGIFWLALQLCRRGARAHQVLVALAAGGLLYAAYGLYEAFRSGTGVVTSTFVNRNSYATYAGMTLLCGLGLAVRGLARHAGRGTSLRRIVLEIAARLDAPLALGVISCLVIGTALLLTQSRGAFVAVCVALVAFARLLPRMTLLTSKAVVRVTAACSIALFLGLLGLAGEDVLGRFAAADEQAQHRIAYYRTTWEALWDRPLLGTGYGTYADAFKTYNHAGTGTDFLDKAHNTYLQVTMELGWPAAVALFASLALLAFRSMRGQSAPYAAVLAACSVLVAVHALVDFSLEMPANAASYALLLGAGCAQAARGIARRDHTTCD